MICKHSCVFVDDGIDAYTIDQIETPANLFKDGAPFMSALLFPCSRPKILDLIQ
jgi:hypothetical protein